jgi:hypothetical protein
VTKREQIRRAIRALRRDDPKVKRLIENVHGCVVGSAQALASVRGRNSPSKHDYRQALYAFMDLVFEPPTP